MKRVTGLFAAMLCVACTSSFPEERSEPVPEELSTGAFVQQNFGCPQASQAVTSVTLKSAEKLGDTNVVVVGWNDVTSTVASVVDTQGNAYALAAPIVRNPGGPNSQAVYYATGTRASTDKVTVTLSAAAWFMDVRVLEYAGKLLLDQSASAEGTSTTASAGPMTLGSGELVVAAGTTYGEFVTSGSGYTERVITTPNGDIVEDRLTTSAGAVTAQAPEDGSPWVFQAVAFRTTALGDGGVDAGHDGGPDTGADTGSDAAQDVAPESAVDTGVDAPAPTEAGQEGGHDAAPEAGDGAAIDASDATADAQSDATVDAGSGATQTLPVPTLVQHVGSATELQSQGIQGNNIKFTPPNPILAGNALILGVAYTSGTRFAATPVTDTNGNTWPTSPSASRTDSAANMDLAIFVLPNAHPGTTTISFHFANNIPQFQYSFSEFYNVATQSPVNGGSGASAVLAPSLSTGSFTPGNNDANGGNLIWSYFFDDSQFGSGNEVTSFTPGPGFTLLDADIAWHREVNPHHATESTVQATAAAINPSLGATMSPAGDSFIGLSIALRAAHAGTAPPSSGIRISRILHNTRGVPPNVLTAQAPSTGNTIVFSTANAGFSDITSITDNKGNSYVKVEPDGSEPQFFVAANAKTGDDLMLTINMAGTPAGISFSIFDVLGAATAPLDATGGMPATDCSNVTSVSSAPVIAPTAAGLAIAVLGVGQGPGLGLGAGAPAGAVFDVATYTNETDFDTMENADGRGHVYNAGAETESWNWAISSQPNNSCFATAIHLLPKASAP
jgi:hypothetical protein